MNTNRLITQRLNYLKNAYIALGLFGFAIPTFLLAIFNMQGLGKIIFGLTGFVYTVVSSQQSISNDSFNEEFSKAVPLVLISVVGLVLGGIIQFYVGIKIIGYGQLETGTIFAVFGGFWIVFSLFHLIIYVSPMNNTALGFLGTYAKADIKYYFAKLSFAVFLFIYATICMVALYVALHRNLTISIIFATLVCAFLCLSISDALQGVKYPGYTSKSFQILGGAASFLAGLGAFYLAWSYILADSLKREVLPLGRPPMLFFNNTKQKRLKVNSFHNVKKLSYQKLKNW